MALTALLVSEQRLKQYTSLDNNTRVEEITPWILAAQDIYIQDLLGTTFYNELRDGVINNTLNNDEKGLLNNYIQPMLCHYALYLMLPSIKYKIVEKGLLSGTSEETAPTTLEELQYVRQSEMDLAQFYQERTREYLRNNPGMFPSYDAPDPLDGMVPNRQRPYYSGLVTSGIKKYKTYYEDYCDGDCPDYGPSVHPTP
jgi:hypothetical protein